jgi:hypothetical protein
MRSLISAALVGSVLAIVGNGAVGSAAAEPQTKVQTAGTSDATDFSAHRYQRRHYRHYGYYRPYYRPYSGAYHRPYYDRPYYYARPVYYRPYPYYAPAPFTFGIGFGPFW